MICPGGQLRINDQYFASDYDDDVTTFGVVRDKPLTIRNTPIGVARTQKFSSLSAHMLSINISGLCSPWPRTYISGWKIENDNTSFLYQTELRSPKIIRALSPI
jgi:hypothetical protein